MSNVIELRPHLRAQPAVDLTDPDIGEAVLDECKRYAISLYQACVKRDDLARAANLAATLATILRAMSAAQHAAEAAATARAILERPDA